MPQSADSWQRVKEVFDRVVDLPRGERTALLERACNGDQALRREVESLLQADADASTFIEKPALPIARDVLDMISGNEPVVGRQFGAYRIVRELGRGGLGTVYLAARADDQYQKEVAIKVVRRGLDTDDILQRFRAERQILAQLEHPNIARLIDAGSTDDGLPYFVMEYVEGQSITAYCETKNLPTRERLDLFRTVCSAVTYAHQHLVVHRDIKPSNILVTTDGTPKLLDFGIAKMLHAGDPLAAQTLTGFRVMTPEYGSPEQVRGGAVTTSTDVYSLGVLLYELLTGQKPYRLTSRTPEEISRAVVEQIPERPSAAVANTTRNSGSKIEIRKSLAGDLDNIVLMALRKEPERRYSSVAQLSGDIGRHLDGLPVIAHKDTVSYRAAKFIKRNKLAVFAAMLLLLTLLAGIVATGWQANNAMQQAQRAEHQRDLAERRFSEVRRLANSLVFELHGAIENLPGSTAARELLVRRALEYLDSLARESQDDASLRRELVSAYLRIGSAQGNPNNPNLGDTAGALRSYREALAIAERLRSAQPGDHQAIRSAGVCLEKLAELQAATGDVTAAVQSARRSLEAFKLVAEAKPADAAAQRSLAISYMKVGDVSGNPNFPNAGDTAAALASYRASLEILQALHAAEPANSGAEQLVGVLQERIGTMLLADGKVDEAEESYLSSQRIRERLAAAEPDNANFVRDAALSHEKIASVQTARGDRAGAVVSRRKSLDIFEQLARADRRNVQAQQSVAISYLHLADLLASDPAAREEARQTYRRGLETLEAVQSPGGLPAKARETADLLRRRIVALESAQ